MIVVLHQPLNGKARALVFKTQMVGHLTLELHGKDVLPRVLQVVELVSNL